MIAACLAGQARKWLPVFLSLLLGGCSALPWSSGGDESGIDRSFELMGRVSVRHQDRVLTGTLRWQHAVLRDEVWLSSPLGDTFAHIVREPTGAALTTANQLVYRSSSVAALTREGLGWSFPLAELGYYVFGEVPPGAAQGQIERTPDGRLTRVVANGWDVEFLSQAEDQPGRPRRLRLRSAEVDIRLVVDRLGLE